MTEKNWARCETSTTKKSWVLREQTPTGSSVLQASDILQKLTTSFYVFSIVYFLQKLVYLIVTANKLILHSPFDKKIICGFAKKDFIIFWIIQLVMNEIRKFEHWHKWTRWCACAQNGVKRAHTTYVKKWEQYIPFCEKSKEMGQACSRSRWFKISAFITFVCLLIIFLLNLV